MALLGGALTDTAFPQRSWWPMAMMGVALLVLALERDSTRWGFAVATVWGLGFFLPHLWWAREAVGTFPWIALSVAEACLVGLAGWAWVWARRAGWLKERRWPHAVVFGSVWTAMELVRSTLPFGGFPWGRLAFSQTDSPLLSLAWLGGAPLVSATVAVLGAALAFSVLAVGRRSPVGALAGPLAFGLALGAAALTPVDSSAESGQVTVGVVQGNVSQPGLHAFANAREVTQNHAAGTHALAHDVGVGGVDVVLWPENASDYDPRRDQETADVIDAAATAIGAPIVLGTQRYTQDARYNESVVWAPGVGIVDVYAKQRPAPFAEYIPLRDLARRFSSAVDLVSTDMAPGQGVGVLEVPLTDGALALGVAICFEVAYDGIVRDSVLSGAELLVVPTNNASFGYTAESEQQLAMTRLRAVELGRATVQVSTVGVSAVVLPDGTMTDETELFTAAHFSRELPLRSSLTPAAVIGEVPALTMAALTVLAAAAGMVTTVRRTRREGTTP